MPKNFIAEWAKKVEQDSKGRLKIELYPSMQLGGTPPQLYDQVKDGVVDIIWTLPGYTAGRFPQSETFELPFIAGNGEQNSQAAWEFYEKHLKDEFKDVHIIAVHTHGPGLIHAKGNGVRKLEDMKGLKLRGPSRMVNKLIENLGATPVGMPVPAMPDALSKGVIDGTVVPWEVTTPLRVSELVNTHTTFSGNRSLYVAFFIFAMNKAKYDGLPAELKKVIDDNSGLATSKWVGKVMDEGDAPGSCRRQGARQRHRDARRRRDRALEGAGQEGQRGLDRRDERQAHQRQAAGRRRHRLDREICRVRPTDGRLVSAPVKDGRASSRTDAASRAGP